MIYSGLSKIRYRYIIFICIFKLVYCNCIQISISQTLFGNILVFFGFTYNLSPLMTVARNNSLYM